MTNPPFPLSRHRRAFRWLADHGVAVIGWSELLGGLATGLWIGFDAFLAPRVGPPPSVLPYAFSFCALSGVAGALMLRLRRNARMLSAVVQLAQLIRFSVGGVTYRAAAGLALTIWYADPGGWDGIVGASATFRLTTPSALEWEFGLNFFSLWALYQLWRYPVGPAPADVPNAA